MNQHTTSSNGLSLVELLVSLSVMGMVLLFCLSYLPSLHKKNQLQVVINQVKRAVQTARTQALITGDTLVLSSIAGANDWSNGMHLFVDNQRHQYTSDTKLLFTWHWQSTGVHVSWHGFQSNNFLLFARELRHSTANGYFVIKNTTEEVKLIVNRLGRVR